MSNESSLRERLERLASTPADVQHPSGFPANVVLRRVAPVDKPVTLAKTLTTMGLTLRTAHQVLNRLVADEEVAITLPFVPEPVTAGETLQGLGIAAEWRSAPDNVDVKAIRERLGLTQAAFAARFGLELDSIRNWEQGRYAPDPVARTLLKVIDQSPEAVDKAVAA